jgi:hypothetical protein
MMLRVYEFNHPLGGLSMTIAIRTDNGEAVADAIANDYLASVVKAPADWWLEDVTEEAL